VKSGVAKNQATHPYNLISWLTTNSRKSPL